MIADPDFCLSESWKVIENKNETKSSIRAGLAVC